MHRLSLQLAALLAGLLVSLSTWSMPVPWSIEIDRVSNGALVLRDVSLTNHANAVLLGQVDVLVQEIEIEKSEIRPGPFVMACPGSLDYIISQTCGGGRWSVRLTEELPQVRGTIQSASLTESRFQLSTRGFVDEMSWDASLDSGEDGFAIRIEIPGQTMQKLDFLAGDIDEFGWISNGEFSGSIDVNGGAGRETWIRSETRLTGIEFDSPDGLYAGLGVEMGFSLGIGNLDNEPVALNGRIESGELLLMDFYRDFSDGPLDFAAFLELQESEIEISRFVVNDGSSLNLAGEARVPLAPATTEGEQAIEIILRELSLDFPMAYSRYIEPVATVYSLDGLETQGVVSWTGDWSPGSARSGTLRINGLSVRDTERGRFGISNLGGELSTFSESVFTWDSLSFEKIDLGEGAASVALTPESVRLTQPLTIGVFGGFFDLEDFSVSLPRGGEPDIQMRASMRDIEILQMTQAMGWPEFGGTLSGSIPGVNWTEGVIEIEGALDFEVFDGQVLLTDLRVERPFGVLPSLAASITATSLDLEELTQTFEFGRIAGRADGYVRNLRMLDWQPVQFDAWFGTPLSDDEKHDISRQAVSHLTTLGGGSATALLTGPVLRLFNDFSYRRLGFGCELQNNICRIRGVDEQDEGVVLMEGAGIPKISILAYNRAVDWPQLLAELSALTSGESIRIGD